MIKIKKLFRKAVKEFKLFILRTFFKNDYIMMNIIVDGSIKIDNDDKSFGYVYHCVINGSKDNDGITIKE
jgi:hypothetical protein